MSKIGTFQIQSDWNSVLKENGKIWISFKFAGENARQGHISFLGAKATISDGFEVLSTSQKQMLVKCIDTGTVCSFIPAAEQLEGIFPKNIEHLDVTRGGLGVAAAGGTEMKIFDVTSGRIFRALEGHLGDVQCAKFFPSGVVILSGGNDMQLKVWSVENGVCAATFVGHVGAITDLAIVDRGRNVISVSKDGAAKLWDCGRSECIATVYKCSSVITSCCLVEAPNDIDLGERTDALNEREIGTDRKVLALGKDDGSVSFISLFSRNVLFERKMPSCVNVVRSDSKHVFIGCDDGTVLVLSLSKPDEPIFLQQYIASSVYSILPWMSGFISSHRDGTVIFIDIENPHKQVEFTGSNFDPVYQLVADDQYLYASCRDGMVRKYDLKAL